MDKDECMENFTTSVKLEPSSEHYSLADRKYGILISLKSNCESRGLSRS